MQSRSGESRHRKCIAGIIAALQLLVCACAAGEVARPAAFVGTWHDPEGITLVLRDDGSATLTHNSSLDARWTVSGDSAKTLCVGARDAVGSDCEPAAVTGNVLTWGAHTFSHR